MSFLEVNNLHAYYGEGQILHGLSLSFERGQFIGVLGRNGVGKTTLLKSIMGVLRARKGSIEFRGANITKLKSYEVARLGISYVPQGREIFSEMTVLENLKLGKFYRQRKQHSIRSDSLIYELFPVLKTRLPQRARTLSGGEQQMLAIARALVAEPELLLLDEPNEGLAPILVQEILTCLKRLKQEFELSTMLVEQNVDFVLALVDKVYVMEKGNFVVEGNAGELPHEEFIKRHLVI
jgi:urea ABC transporter ATP-binding protein UrtE